MAKQTFTTGQVLTAAQMTSLQETAMGGGPATAKTANYVLVAADAGTTVAMDAAGATTITVNTGLFAAGDTVFIQNIGAGACTITAGTATVDTAGSLILPQYDAGILYFTSASAAIFYDYIQVGATSPLTTKGDLYTYSTSDTRLGVGADGTTLVADSSTATGLKWAAPAGGSGLTLIERATFTTTTSIISNAVFSATYDNYLILININLAATGAPSLELRMRTGSTTTTTGYTFAQANATQASAAAFYGGSNVGAWDITAGQTTFGTFHRLNLSQPYANEITHYNSQNDWTQSGSTMQVRNQAGFLNDTTSYDKFDIISQYNVTGYYAVYGFAKS